jgi:hypothetical protein
MNQSIQDINMNQSIQDLPEELRKEIGKYVLAQGPQPAPQAQQAQQAQQGPQAPSGQAGGKKLNKTRKTRRVGLCKGFCCDSTCAGLEKWYTTEFEKLGWMVLAKERGMNEKCMMYKYSLDNLCKSLQHKMDFHVCKDERDDLMIMLQNVEVLQKHVEKDFP